MKRILFSMLIFLAGGFVIRQLSQDEQRERFAHLPATMMEKYMEMMPEGSPPKVVMSSLRRIQEQNEQLLALLRERLPAQEPASPETPAPSAEPKQN